MVKTYQRFEQSAAFGIISGESNAIWQPSGGKSNAGPGRLITGALERIKIWDIKSSEVVSVLSDGLPIGSVDAKSSKPAFVTKLDYHEDTNLLAAGYSDGSIKIWDLLSGSVLLTFNGHKSAISALKFDETGTRLYSGSRDSNIIGWDLVGEVGLFKLRSHKEAITDLWVYKEDWIISVSKDGLIKVWDLKTQQCIETHIAHTGECWAMAVYDDLLITTGTDTQVKFWNLNLEDENGKKLVEKGVYDKQSKQRGLSVTFTQSTDGTAFFFIQNADRTVEVFRIRKEEEISRALKKREKRLKEKGMSDEEIQENVEKSYISLIMHPFQTVKSQYKIKSASWTIASASKLELAVTTSSNTIEYYSIPYEKRDPSLPAPQRLYEVEQKGHRTDVRAIDISDDDNLLSTASNGLMKIWNLKTQSCLRTFDCNYALCCKFLPGGTLVVLGTREGQLQLYDLASSTMIENVENAHEGAIWSLDITSDGKRLVTGSADKTVKFWNFEIQDDLVPGTKDKFQPTMKLAYDTILELNDDILSVRISPEDKFLAISLLDNTVKVFFFDSMKFYLSLYGHKLPVLSIDISHDSKLIITSSADKNIKIWGLDFGDCHKSLFAHQDSIMNVKFLPESHDFFSASKDGLIKYWDGDKFECIQKLAGHQSEIWALAITNDGTKVVSASHDHSLRIWEETEDQVFLEEEREKDLEESYEETLLASLEEGEGDDAFRNDVKSKEVDYDSSLHVQNQTMESLKAGERLMEALNMGMDEIEAGENYEKEMNLWQKKKNTEAPPIKPQENAIFLAIKKTPIEYILETLMRIKPSQTEDALLVMPFSYVLKFLKFLDILLKDTKNANNYIALICKNLFFIIRSNHKELVSQRNAELKQQIINVRNSLRTSLTANVDNIGFNIQGLKFIQQQWNLKHNHEFLDEYDQQAQEAKTAKKRVFGTLA